MIMSGLNLDHSHNGTTLDFDTMPSIDNSSLGAIKQPRRRKSHTKRSAHACSRCRTRKVRCDVSIRGHPCSNCNWEEVHCTDPSPKTNRKKKYMSSSPCCAMELIWGLDQNLTPLVHERQSYLIPEIF